jgi:riboflavin synthase
MRTFPESPVGTGKKAGIVFTGIIEDRGEIRQVKKVSGGLSLVLGTNLPLDTLPLGSSLSVDGVCLTVSGHSEGCVIVDVSQETLGATTLGERKSGQRVHLERALSIGGRLGGHWVTGHIDAVGELLSRSSRGRDLELVIRVPKVVDPYLVSKGSIAVDGVSLTIHEKQADHFRVVLIPHTLDQTLLREKREREKVNLEADILGKYVHHFLIEGKGSVLDEQYLIEHGFMKAADLKPTTG